MILLCKKKSSCPSCGATNGVVKKGALLKIIHDFTRAPGIQMSLTLPYLPKVGSKGSIATEGKILQNRGDFKFEASVRSTLTHCCA